MKWLAVLAVAVGCQGTQRQPVEVAIPAPAPLAERQAPPPATVPSEPTAPEPAAPEPAAPEPAAVIADAEIIRIGKHTFRVSRAAFERLHSDLSLLERGARIVPTFVNGKPGAGVRLYGIRPGTIYERLGFEVGDLVLRIGGRDVTDPESVLEAHRSLEGATSLAVHLKRRGTPLTLTYRIEK